ncbi:hypothetical protein LTR10_014984 [Elasticomyces elasticus]|nr:hypothetical protein LTR10_014984 [Elasticomyces elasticus]KAK4964562.1 hypothetical protein LTR42_012858 [Elasticomyces elasticus]
MHPDPRKRKRASETIDLTKDQRSQRQKICSVQAYIDANLTAAKKEAMFNGVIIQKHAADETKRHLMALPEELRLHIFEYIVLEADSIIVTANGPHQPTLLRVCREIRKMTLPLYYTCNGFVYDAMDYNMAQLVPALKTHEKYFDPPDPYGGCGWDSEYHFRGKEVGLTGVEFTGVPNWQNLVEWVRLAYKYDHVPWFGDEDAVDPGHIMLTALFQAMMNLQEEEISWAAAASTLEAWHRMFILNNAAWAT